MEKVAVVEIFCPECGHAWKEILDATYEIEKEEVSCPADGCSGGYVRDYEHVVLKELSIKDIMKEE